MRAPVPARFVEADAPVLDLLRELVKGQRQIIQLLERQHRPSSVLTPADRELLARLLPAIGGAIGSEPFTSRDLAADSSPGLRLVLQGRSAKSIGRLLARAEGCSIEGWLIERYGVEINVTLWRVVAAVSHGEKAAWTAGDRV